MISVQEHPDAIRTEHPLLLARIMCHNQIVRTTLTQEPVIEPIASSAHGTKQPQFVTITLMFQQTWNSKEHVLEQTILFANNGIQVSLVTGPMTHA